ncbi:MAG: hypothetical protein A2289_04370 [Deltaproteobacteria bacterium RIFOXYA12_FULL_58_15]|nr:MAG: hypothetical protein A2289_04370 [Deltaproteobacteria bacterium RIFOXYA12_FULL_58_15]OGR10396.1 MAG: hypothetical protein A2341_23030 [Deltaproteobacteria bacterium RIFOXYB12_FULL_58_9]
MRNITTIAIKDLWIALTTWLSYILFAAFTLITGFLFYQLVKEFQLQLMELTQGNAHAYIKQMNLTDWVMGPVFFWASVALLILVPLFSMGLIAGERRARTLELLLTTPVRPIEIVLGKFAAGSVLILIMLALTLVFPFLLHILGEGETSPIDWNTIWVAYLGVFLMGASCLAMGLLASAASDSQIVAAVLSIAVLLILLFMGLAARGQEGALRDFLAYIGLTSHLESFVSGVIKISDLVYYLSFIFLGLFFTHQVVEAQRWR